MTNILDSERERIVTRLAVIAAHTTDLVAEAEGLKNELRALGVGEWSRPDGTPVVRIVPNRRFDPDTAIGLLEAEDRVDVLKVVIDPTALKRKLTAEQIEEHMVEAGQPKVVIL